MVPMIMEAMALIQPKILLASPDFLAFWALGLGLLQIAGELAQLNLERFR